MSEIEQRTAAHYGRAQLGPSILAALRRMGKDVNALTPDDLAPVDAFHVRGRQATEELARHCAVDAAQQVLDVGCGLGGSARYLAVTTGCTVIGLDLTPAYVEAATLLTAQVGLADRVTFRTGSALALPFAEGAFDVAWTEHAQMNIPDKASFFGEMHRVLKPGGRLAFHDVLQGPGGEPHYPVPWASDPTYSALIGAADLRALLQGMHFDVRLWEDKTATAREWFQKTLARLREKGPPPLGLHLLLGRDYQASQENQLRNLEEDRIRLVQAVLQKVG